jgi:hypothetical protein
MTAKDVMRELEKLGDAQTRKTFLRHGCNAPSFGVKVADLKVLVKKIGKDTKVAKELYKTGNADAQYLAGLIANGAMLRRSELQQWARTASWHMVSEYTVPWVASEHPDGWEMALAWIDSPEESVASSGWSTLAGMVAVRPDAELDLDGMKKLLVRVTEEIHGAPNRVRSTMNGFVIAVGSSCLPLARQAMSAAKAIGDVSVDVGDSACKVPLASEYIEKAIARSGPGRKRKTLRC